MNKNKRSSAAQTVTAVVLAAMVNGVDAEPDERSAAAALRAGLYHLEAQMVMPHLDEMRRISEHHEVCITGAHAEHLFPVFLQPALTGCVLQPQSASDVEIDYKLVCAAVNGGSGTARIELEDDRLKGTLNAKMGGKNMTFSQFIQAQWRAPCSISE